jgi:deaminated glutathione amidase
MSTLLVSQRDWSLRRPAELAALVAAAAATHYARELLDPAPVPLLLLPLCCDEPVAGVEAVAGVIGPLAREHRVFVAGALRVRTGEGGVFHTVGFVVADSGELRLATPKRSPDLVTGLAEGATAPSGEATGFVACPTPVGQVAVLPGEDVLFPQLARAATFAGAEVILNPAAEVHDSLFEARRIARIARAWENTACVATAAGAADPASGPGVSVGSVVDWTGADLCRAQSTELLVADVDVERLRRRRDAIFAVQPLHLRARLYADGYRRLLERLPSAPAAPTTRIEWGAEARRRLADQPAPARPAGFIEQYDVILTQTVQKIIQRETDVVSVRLGNIRAGLKLAGRLASNPGSKLVVFGEFFMHGQGGHGYRSPLTLQRLAIRYPGPELELLQDFAQRNRTYVAGSSFEIDDRLPGHVFNSAFILNDSGELIHRYRKIQCADVWGSLPDTTPSSIYDRYLDLYGYDFLFPVANTPIGRLATMVCFDQAHPEVARMLTRHGAEVIIHPSSEGHGSGRYGWDCARRARAFENTAYVLSAMPGGEHFDPDSPDPYTVQMRGHSKLINFDGSVQGEADTAGPCILTGTIDLRALQRARANPRVNLVAWDDPAAYVAAYEADVGLPNNLWGDDPLKNPYSGFGPLKRVLASYYERGIFVPPAGRGGLALPSARLHSQATADPTVRLADQRRIDGEHIQI